MHNAILWVTATLYVKYHLKKNSIERIEIIYNHLIGLYVSLACIDNRNNFSSFSRCCLICKESYQKVIKGLFGSIMWFMGIHYITQWVSRTLNCFCAVVLYLLVSQISSVLFHSISLDCLKCSLCGSLIFSSVLNFFS